jgi:hypothetical protein
LVLLAVSFIALYLLTYFVMSKYERKTSGTS